MKNKFWLFAVPALMAVSTASAVEIDFTNQLYFDTSENGYNYLGVIDISGPPPAGISSWDGSGYKNVSLETGATVFGFPIYEHPLTFKYIGPGDSFTLDRFYFASAWGPQTVTFTGYYKDNGPLTLTFETTTDAQLYDFTSWGAIDKLVVETSGEGLGWALGSVNITAVPEPESYAMLLAGLAIVGAVARRRAALRA
jgi:hypothetical protein